jgi:hypothetical protein
VLRWGDREAVVPDLLGLSYLAQLLTNPGREIAATALVGSADLGAGDDRYLVLDDAALAAYRERIRDLQDDLAEADANNDPERSARVSAELDAVVAEVSGHTDVRGRSRAFASSGERARTAVQKAVRRAFDAIDQVDAELGAALRASIQTGRSCCYRPGPGAPARWRVAERPVA